MEQSPYILTYSNKQFHFLSDDVSEVDINDIAKALSQVNRYTGHTKMPYSVAEHSVHVASLLPPEYQLAGLLHDASEAYLNDISSPLKSLLPDYRAIEETVQNKILRHFGVTAEHMEDAEKHVKYADITLYFSELYNINPEEYAISKQNIPECDIFNKIEESPTLKLLPFFIPNTIAEGVFRKAFRMISNGIYLTQPFTSQADMTSFLLKR